MILVKTIQYTNHTYHEEGHGTSSLNSAVLDVRLIGQVVGRFDRDLHPLNRQERRKVRRVGGDDDQRKGPPVSQTHKQPDITSALQMAVYIRHACVRIC